MDTFKFFDDTVLCLKEGFEKSFQSCIGAFLDKNELFSIMIELFEAVKPFVNFAVDIISEGLPYFGDWKTGPSRTTGLFIGFCFS